MNSLSNFYNNLSHCLIPTNECMFAKNAPDLKEMNLCKFLKDMDVVEESIQNPQDIESELLKEREVNRLLTKRKTSGVGKIATVVSVGLGLGYGFLIKNCFDNESTSKSFGFRVVQIFTSLGGGIVFGGLTFLAGKKLEDNHLSLLEYQCKGYEPRLKRLAEKIESLRVAILESKNKEELKEETEQMRIALDFFRDSLENYEEKVRECPKTETIHVSHHHHN